MRTPYVGGHAGIAVKSLSFKTVNLRTVLIHQANNFNYICMRFSTVTLRVRALWATAPSVCLSCGTRSAQAVACSTATSDLGPWRTSPSSNMSTDRILNPKFKTANITDCKKDQNSGSRTIGHKTPTAAEINPRVLRIHRASQQILFFFYHRLLSLLRIVNC